MKRRNLKNKILSFLLILVFIFTMTGCIKKVANKVKNKLNKSNTNQSEESNLPKTVKITFPEGYTYEQIKTLLVENNVCTEDDLDSALNTEYDYKFFDDDSKNPDIPYSLEGYLYPDTYEFYIDDEPEYVYDRFLSNLNNKLKDEYYSRAEELGMSMHEILTLASIIQKEASVASEMKDVSSVFHNRLKANMRLQTDVTVWYPNTKEDVPENERENYYKNNPYNTYSINGLPVGPICNPGIEAIEAALYPSDTNYYFFVSDSNGKYYYADTYEKHKANCEIALADNIKA